MFIKISIFAGSRKENLMITLYCGTFIVIHHLKVPASYQHHPSRPKEHLHQPGIAIKISLFIFIINHIKQARRLQIVDVPSKALKAPHLNGLMNGRT